MSLGNLNFDEDGLIPAIIQDAESDEVLMMAYMNEESLKNTIRTGRTCFWSRSREELWWKGDDLMGRIELLNTPAGNIVKEICKAGHTIGISSRGTGSVQQTNEGTLEVQPDFELVCWDFVSNPSTHGAFMNPVSLNEGKQQTNKYGKLNTIINDILRA